MADDDVKLDVRSGLKVDGAGWVSWGQGGGVHSGEGWWLGCWVSWAGLGCRRGGCF